MAKVSCFMRNGITLASKEGIRKVLLLISPAVDSVVACSTLPLWSREACSAVEGGSKVKGMNSPDQSCRRNWTWWPKPKAEVCSEKWKVKKQPGREFSGGFLWPLQEINREKYFTLGTLYFISCMPKYRFSQGFSLVQELGALLVFSVLGFLWDSLMPNGVFLDFACHETMMKNEWTVWDLILSLSRRMWRK